MSKYVVSSSPHIANDRTVMTIMIDVLIALVPAVVGSIYFFGFYAWFLAILSVGSAIGAEALFNLITKREQTIGDCSAPVTGLLLALNLPVTVPFYVPIIGSAFAIIFVKMLFGGIAQSQYLIFTKCVVLVNQIIHFRLELLLVNKLDDIKTNRSVNKCCIIIGNV